jgi:galactokinase
MEGLIDSVQVFEHLDKIYNKATIKKHEERYANLKNRFKLKFGHHPTFYCRAPGRVNIIGEHIDYCGYSVLPAAIEQDFVIAYSVVEEGKEGCD